MILNFTVENYTSFFSEQTISFEHQYSKSNIFKNNTIFEFMENNKKKAVLNGVILFGANAAGKSNVFNYLKVLQNYYNRSIKFDTQKDITVEVNSFKFSSSLGKNIKFKIAFVNKIEQNHYKINYESVL